MLRKLMYTDIIRLKNTSKNKNTLSQLIVAGFTIPR